MERGELSKRIKNKKVGKNLVEKENMKKDEVRGSKGREDAAPRSTYEERESRLG